MLQLSDIALGRLREKHQVLAEVIDSDREVAAQRSFGIIDLDAVRLRRERVRAAEARWGHQFKGSGDRHA